MIEYFWKTSDDKQKDQGTQLKSTTYQCIDDCLNFVYNKYDKYCWKHNQHPKCPENKDLDAKKLYQFLDEENMDELCNMVGAPLPEITKTGYYDSDLKKSPDKKKHSNR